MMMGEFVTLIQMGLPVKVVVLNKFLPTEGRINTLIDIVPQLVIAPGRLSPEARKVYLEVMAAHQLNEE